MQEVDREARLRALELQVATEVTNAALSVQSNLKRVEAAVAARELAEKRLEAEQSKFEVGMSTNFFVVQAQRDLRDAQNAELRALADYRKSLVIFERVQEAPSGGGGGVANAINAVTSPCFTMASLANLRTSYGFGFRWFSPLGPLRFEWGYPFKPLSYEQASQFEFTIGNFF